MTLWGAFRNRSIGLGLVMAGLAAWSLAPAGIIELGKKGQTSKGSLTRLIVEGCRYEIAHVNGQTADQILGQMIACLNTDPNGCLTTPGAPCDDQDFQAAPFQDTGDPNRNAMSVELERASREASDLRVYDNDREFSGAGVDHPNTGRGVSKVVFVEEASEICGTVLDPNDVCGNVVVKVFPANGGPSTDVTVDSSAATDVDDFNDMLFTELQTTFGAKNNSNVSRADGVITVRLQGQPARLVRYERADPDVDLAVGLDFTPFGQVPALTEWGMLILVLGLAAMAVVVLLRRRHARAA